jgi:predicted RNase H-like nuclease
VRILGVDLTRQPRPNGSVEHVLVLLDDDGRVASIQTASTLPGVAAAVAQLVGDEPFLLGANTPVVVPAKPAKVRPVENLVRRRFRYRLAPGGRASLQSEPLGVAGEALIAGLAAAGMPCLPYPDRDRRKSGLAETYPGLILKTLIWDSSALAKHGDGPRREELFRAFSPPTYRTASMPARSNWADQAVALEYVLRIIDSVDGFDLRPARDQLAGAKSTDEVEYAAALLDATLIAGTARRYLDDPEHSVFLGDHEGGYLVLPADGLVRRLALGEPRPAHGKLFPQDSLRKRLGSDAKLNSPDLLSVPGRPRRIEATFVNHPHYEFDNLDEMMWWKHCRHVSGPHLPTEGLSELVVTMETPLSISPKNPSTLRLVRSRHRTLSFRFDPPQAWRQRVPTRDGQTYPFKVMRAVYETMPIEE